MFSISTTKYYKKTNLKENIQDINFALGNLKWTKSIYFLDFIE